MKVIVFQTLLDKGYIGKNLHINGKPSENLLIIKTCMESVRAWCKEHNFNYVLCQNNLGWNYAQSELSSLGYEDIPLHGYDLCAQRHALIDDYDADLKIILDNDVWVHLDFVLPDVKVGICESGLYSYTTPKKDKREVIKTVSIANQLADAPYPQGGVQFISKQFSKHYCDWMVSNIKSSNMPIMFGDYEQSYIFEYTRQFPENITWLSPKYNCVPSRYDDETCRNSYLIHFPGAFKPRPLSFLPNNFRGDEFSDLQATREVIKSYD